MEGEELGRASAPEATVAAAFVGVVSATGAWKAGSPEMLLLLRPVCAGDVAAAAPAAGAGLAFRTMLLRGLEVVGAGLDLRMELAGLEDGGG